MTFRQRLISRFGLWLGLLLVLMLGTQYFLEAQRLRDSVVQNLQNITDALRVVASTSLRIYQQQVTANIRTVEERLAHGVRQAKGNEIVHVAQDQITGITRKLTLPALEIADTDGTWKPLRTAFASERAAVIGGTVTVFQRFEGGLLRVSTSIRRSNGESAVGTYIPTQSPVYRAISAGRPFSGRAFVVDDWYITRYEPVRNAAGAVIGAIYVGVSQQSLGQLEEAISNFRLIDSYYTTVVDIAGNLVIHPKWKGRNVHAIETQSAEDAFATMLAAIQRDGITSGSLSYALEGRKRVNYYAYVPEAEWIIVSGVDASAISERVLAGLSPTLGFAAFAISIFLVVVWYVSGAVVRPLSALTAAASRMSQREFDVALPEFADQEMRSLGAALTRMASDLGQSYQDLQRQVENRTAALRQKQQEAEDKHQKASQAVAALEQEVSHRQDAEKALRASESQYRALVSNFPGIIIQCAPEPPYRVTFVSSGLRDLTGRDPDSLYQDPAGLLDLFPEDARDRVHARLENLIQTGVPISVACRYGRADDTVGWLDFRAAIVDEEGSRRTIDCVALDISAQRDATAKLQQAREQDAAQRGRLEMSSSVLHDIGNAITNLGTTINRLVAEDHWSENLQFQQLQGLVATEQHALKASLGTTRTTALTHFLGELQRCYGEREERYRIAFGRLAATVQHVNEILHLQRRYSHASLATSRERIDVRHIIDDALSICSGSLEKRDITLNRHDDGHRTTVSGDKTRLLQVFNNVLKNACEAIDARRARDPSAPGSLELRSTLDSTGHLQLRFTDSGAGFDETIGGKLFKRGFTTKSTGTGIGLVQCRSIMQAHGGAFLVESAGVDQGTTVTVVMPTIDAEGQTT